VNGSFFCAALDDVLAGDAISCPAGDSTPHPLLVDCRIAVIAEP